MTTTDGERADRVAQVWEMHSTLRMTVRAIAAETHLSVGTVHNYIQQGKAAEGYVHLHDVAEQRDLMAAQLDSINRALFVEHEQGTKMSKIAPILLQIMARRARLLGLDMPQKVAVTDDREQEVDPAVLAAVREAQRRAATERRELGAPPSEGGAG